MKIPSFLFVFLLASFATFGQTKNNINYFTLYGGISLSNTGVTFSLESIFHKNRGLSITREVAHFVTPNYPKPYTGSGLLGGAFGESTEPQSLLWISSISALQKFSTIHERLRFGTEIGISLVELQAPIFDYRGATTWLGNNGYKIIDRTREKTVGVNLRASLDLLLSKNFGLEFGIKSNLNFLHSTFGVDVKFTTGFLRKRIAEKQ